MLTILDNPSPMLQKGSTAELLGSSLLVAVLLLFGFVLSKTVYNAYFHPLRSYPGPWLSRATRLHYVYHQLVGDLPYQTKLWHDAYGEVVRIAPDELSYNSSRAHQDVHSWRSKAQRSGLEKDTTWYSQSINDTAVTAKSEDHGRLRNVLSHAFSDHALVRQEPLISMYMDLLVRKLHAQTKLREKVDLVPWFTSLAMDVILDLSFGRSINCLEDTTGDELHPWVQLVTGHVRQGLFVQAWRRLPALVSRNILANLALMVMGRQWKNQFDVTTQMARERMSRGTEREDFVSHLLLENNEKNGMTAAELELTSSIFMTAGSDTNATLLCGATYFMLRDRAVWEKLRDEIRCSFTQESNITFREVQKLDYLNAVIEEALRLYVVVPSTFPRRTPSEGATICGRFVPGDFAVGVNGYAAALSETNFARADEFHPERWLEATDPQFNRDDKKAHQPFSTGPRNCLGKNMALAFARLAIARLVWNFDMELAPECQNWHKDQDAFVMFVKKPLLVRLKSIVR